MILHDDWVKHDRKLFVGVPVSCIDATVLVVELDGTGNGLGQCEATGRRFNGGQLVPDILKSMTMLIITLTRTILSNSDAASKNLTFKNQLKIVMIY